ncbi:MAG: oxidoreductase [Rhodobiaceae bacterium]|jgi:flavin reductase (DIM6/NTAB) family NADH-FMN oxidoreductase RutF|nr:oxidoreductase [Rhodobiaceae bacterium]|tara:strand:- start:15874 stop:16350 length:477 start_codon:yes stop_codon:yes gene_type:complete
MKSSQKNSESLRKIFARFATGVTAITFSSKNNKFLGITVNSYTSVSLEPPLVLWCLDKDSELYDELMDKENYVINFLSENQRSIAIHLAKKNDHSLDKVKHRIEGSNCVIEGVVGWISCSKVETFDAGDHDIILGKVIDFNYNQRNPLIFWDSKYKAL